MELDVMFFTKKIFWCTVISAGSMTYCSEAEPAEAISQKEIVYGTVISARSTTYCAVAELVEATLTSTFGGRALKL